MVRNLETLLIVIGYTAKVFVGDQFFSRVTRWEHECKTENIISPKNV